MDEILKSKDFRQGSHQESQPFSGVRYLPLIMENTLIVEDLKPHSSAKKLLSTMREKNSFLNSKSLEECEKNRDEDGIVRADLAPTSSKHVG